MRTTIVWSTLSRWANKVANAIDILVVFVNFVTLAPSNEEPDRKVPPTFGKVKLKRPRH